MKSNFDKYTVITGRLILLQYVTYLISYSGNDLPPFYIGYTSLSKWNNGYCGSVSSKKYKHTWKEKTRYSPEKFKRQIIKFHENSEQAIQFEGLIHSKFNVVTNPLYVNMSSSGNSRKHPGFSGSGADNPMHGKKHSDESRLKMSKTKRGKQWSQKQRNSRKHFDDNRPPVSEETKRKLSAIKTGLKHSEETKRKLSILATGKYVGNKNPMYGKSARIGTTHTPETKEKMAKARKIYWETKRLYSSGVTPQPTMIESPVG